MTNKMTYGKALEIAISTMTDGEVKDKLVALKASIDKKNSAERKPTATQKANEQFKQEIVEYFKTCDTPKLISDLIAEIPALHGMTPQKVGPMVRALEAEGALEKVVDKRRTYWKAA